MKLIKRWKRWRKKRNERTVVKLRSQIKGLKDRDKMLVSDLQRKVDLINYLIGKISMAQKALD